MIKKAAFLAPFLALLSFASRPALAEDPPTGDALMQKYLDATGGKAAYEAVKTAVATGTMSMPAAGIKGTIALYSAYPDKSYAVMELPGVGKMEEGTDGNIAWENSAIQGARIKSGDEAAAAIRDSALDAHANWKKYYESAKVQGIESVNGKPCYKVVMTPKQGSPETVYFEKDSGLIVRQSATYDTPMGRVPVEINLSDYQKQGGVLVPMRLVNHMAEQEFEIKLDKFEINAPISDDRFVPPAEVQKLKK